MAASPLRSADVLPFPRRTPAISQRNVEDGPRTPVAKLRKALTEAIAAKVNENQEAAEAEKYFHGSQWTGEELRTLDDRRQPAITFNRIKRKINTIMGILEKLRQDPKAYARTPTQPAEDGAELATKTVRYALGWDWQDLATLAGRRCATRGIAGAELVLIQGDQGDPEIAWDAVDMRDFFYDPKSTKHDFSDARFMGTTRWVDLDEAIAEFPDFEDDLTAYVENGPSTDWERGDERTKLAWMNPKERQVRLVDQWYMVGKTWFYCIYVGNVALEFGPSPHKNEKGASVSKFEMLCYDIDQDGDRYAIYRDLKGPQDEINHRRSKALHQLNSRKVIADDGAVDDVEVARRELARSDGWVVKNPGKELVTEDAQAAQVVKGNLDMLAEAKAEIDTFGPNPGLIGTDIPAESGRAIALLQAAGVAELGVYIAAYKNWKVRIYRKTWNACQQFWTAPRWLRVTDDEQMQQFIQVNGWERDPQTGMPIAINQLAALDVDIILDEGPDVITSQAEIFDLLLALAKGGMNIAPEAIITMSALPSSVKQQVIQKLQPTQMDQQALMMKADQLQQQIEVLKSQAVLNYAKAGQSQVEGQATAIEAQRPPPPQQIDTPADQAKAAKDLAQAKEIEHKIAIGAHVPQQAQPQPPPPPAPGLFDLNLAKARESHARADQAQAQAGAADAQKLKTLLEAQTIREAPQGMLQRPPPGGQGL